MSSAYHLRVNKREQMWPWPNSSASSKSKHIWDTVYLAGYGDNYLPLLSIPSALCIPCPRFQHRNYPLFLLCGQSSKFCNHQKTYNHLTIMKNSQSPTFQHRECHLLLLCAQWSKEHSELLLICWGKIFNTSDRFLQLRGDFFAQRGYVIVGLPKSLTIIYNIP